MRLFLLFISLSFVYSSNAQSIRGLKCQFILDGVPIEGLTGIIGNSSFVTDEMGKCDIDVRADNDNVLASLDKRYESKYKIIYPNDRKIPLLKDENYVFQIHLSNNNTSASIDQKTTNELFKRINQIKADINFDAFKQELKSIIHDYNSSIDQKMLSGIQQQVELLESIRRENEKTAVLIDDQKKIEEEKEQKRIKQGKVETLNLIGSTFDHYLSRLKDLRDIFESKGDQVFYNNNVLLIVKERIDAYSEAYESVDKNRKLMMNKVDDYWQKEILTLEFRRLLDEILEKTHKQTNLTFNLIISDIDHFNNGRGLKKRRKKSAIKQDIRTYVTKVSNDIETLEKEKERVYQKLIDK